MGFLVTKNSLDQTSCVACRGFFSKSLDGLVRAVPAGLSCIAQDGKAGEVEGSPRHSK